ncbi:MAG: LuxR C-terminal-related transcriptional regulator [Pseudomonadota bacterium]
MSRNVTWLVDGKLKPPRPTGVRLPRELIRDKAREKNARLVVVQAPAGYGKTTLLADFAAAREAEGAAVAWVSLTDAEQDGLYLLRSVTESFARLGWRLAEQRTAPLQGGEERALAEAAEALLGALARRDEASLLILDDFHWADSASSRRVLATLAKGAPRNFAMILSSRTAPELDLTLLRLRRHLGEIDMAELRFSSEESAAFLMRNAPGALNDQDLQRVHRVMDGWAMGLQAAAITIGQSGGAPQFLERAAAQGSDLSEFLAEEILTALGRDLRAFLRDTAHLEILTPDLCDACADRTDSAARLQELSRLNLFVQAIADQPGWYRYHHLFRSFLLSHFGAEEDPTTLRRHQRSYAWFAAHGQAEFAIQHALAAGMWAEARETLEGVWKQWLSSSRYEQLQGWLRRLPEDQFEQSTALQIAMVWADALQRRLTPARERLMGLLAAQGAEGPNLELTGALRDDPIRRDLLVLRGAIDTMLDHSESLAALAEGPPHAQQEALRDVEPFSRGLILSYIVYARVLSGKFDLADRMVEDAVEAQMASGDTLVAIHSLFFAGLGRQMTGDLPGAQRAFGRAAELSAEHISVRYSAPHSLQAAIYYEWGDLTAAARCLDQARAASLGPSVLDPVIAQYLTAAKLAQARGGGASEGLEILAEAERLGREEGGARLLLSALAERVRLLLAHDRVEEALALETELQHRAGDTDAARRSNPSIDVWPMADSLVAQARAAVRLRLGDPADAQRILAPFLARASSSGRVHAWIKLSVLDVLACDAAGKEQAAIRKLSQTIARAAEGRYLQVFVDQLSEKKGLLSAALNRCALDGVDRGHIRGVAEAVGVPMAGWTQGRGLANTAEEDVAPAVALTVRELDLLQALRAGMTNKSIARDMGISDNTVAWHLKNLFGKLGVRNRTAAVSMAQRRSLLD